MPSSRSSRLGTATLRLDVPWQDGQPYLVSMLTSTGAVIEHEIPVAVATPVPSGEIVGRMALLGTFVGVVPVAARACCSCRRCAGPAGRLVRALLALTVGLLAFLAVDAAVGGGRAGRGGRRRVRRGRRWSCSVPAWRSWY